MMISGTMNYGFTSKDMVQMFLADEGRLEIVTSSPLLNLESALS
jgi:hypothetical protein